MLIVSHPPQKGDDNKSLFTMNIALGMGIFDYKIMFQLIVKH